MANRKVTGADVARLAGVSKSSVSRAFTGGITSDDARLRILEAARALKYRPSNTARSLTTSRSRMIGIAVTHLDNQFYPEVVEKLSDRFARSGYRLLLFVTHGEAGLEPMLDELLGYGLDGVVLASSSMASQVAAECHDAGVPVIMFNNVDPEGLQPGISADDEGGAALVARYLIAAGHCKTAVITGLSHSTTSERRLHGFRQQVIAKGLPEPAAISGEYTFEGALAATLTLLDAADPPDALFCINDHMAIGALHALHQRGLQPGRDVSVIGFDNAPVTSWPLLGLTTLSQPLPSMVEATVTSMLKAIDGMQHAPVQQVFPGHLVVRTSARRAPGIVTDETGGQTWEG